jgi:hypothetical protein
MIVTTIATGIVLGIQFLILLIGWYTISIITYFSKESHVAKERIILVTISYPVIEIILKIFLNYNVIPFSWLMINRLEHIIFSALLTYFVYIIIDKNKIVNSKFGASIFVFSLINVFGIINEFIEYFIRIYFLKFTSETYLTKFSAYYSDTIFDLAMNFISAFLVLLLISIYNRYKNGKKKLS